MLITVWNHLPQDWLAFDFASLNEVNNEASECLQPLILTGAADGSETHDLWEAWRLTETLDPQLHVTDKLHLLVCIT